MGAVSQPVPVSQFILSLGDSVAATKYPRKFCRERHNLLGYFVAARIYCRCTYRRGGIAILSDYTNTIGHQQIALLAKLDLGKKAIETVSSIKYLGIYHPLSWVGKGHRYARLGLHAHINATCCQAKRIIGFLYRHALSPSRLQLPYPPLLCPNPRLRYQYLGSTSQQAD